jgi:hypothetical protein
MVPIFWHDPITDSHWATRVFDSEHAALVSALIKHLETEGVIFVVDMRHNHELRPCFNGKANRTSAMKLLKATISPEDYNTYVLTLCYLTQLQWTRINSYRSLSAPEVN